MKNKILEEGLEFKDDFIKDLVKKGNRTISNEDFENQIMHKIHATTVYKKEMASKLKRSMYFFYCGLSLIGTYTLITILSRFASNNTTNFIAVLTLFFVIIIGIICIGNYKRFLHAFSF